MINETNNIFDLNSNHDCFVIFADILKNNKVKSIEPYYYSGSTGSPLNTLNPKKIYLGKFKVNSVVSSVFLASFRNSLDAEVFTYDNLINPRTNLWELDTTSYLENGNTNQTNTFDEIGYISFNRIVITNPANIKKFQFIGWLITLE